MENKSSPTDNRQKDLLRRKRLLLICSGILLLVLVLGVRAYFVTPHAFQEICPFTPEDIVQVEVIHREGDGSITTTNTVLCRQLAVEMGSLTARHTLDFNMRADLLDYHASIVAWDKDHQEIFRLFDPDIALVGNTAYVISADVTTMVEQWMKLLQD